MFRSPSLLVDEVQRRSAEAARNPHPGPAPKLQDSHEERQNKQLKRLRKDAFPLLKASYQPLDVAGNTLAAAGYRLDPELSTEETKVATNRRGHPVVLHRGSKTLRDWAVSDTAILTGTQELDPRLKRARTITDQAREKYGHEPGAVGHSLGGRLAQESGARGPVVTYNAAAGLGDFGRQVPANVQQVRTPFDVVSVISRTQPKVRPAETVRAPRLNLLEQAARAIMPGWVRLGATLTEAHSLSNLMSPA